MARAAKTRGKKTGTKSKKKTVAKAAKKAVKAAAPPKLEQPARMTPGPKPALRLPVRPSTRAPVKVDRPRPRSLGDRLLIKDGL